MTSTIRQAAERRKPDRRNTDLKSFHNQQSSGGDRSSVRQERRSEVRRYDVDRRSDMYWRFSWLRLCITQQLAA